jgi:hypothetical protein
VQEEAGPLSDAEPLAAEARIFGHYLVGAMPTPELIERYVTAATGLLSAPPEPADAAVLGFVHRHPWSVSYLDAACGLLRPAGLLRSKLLIMAAVLEASPVHAAEFLPRAVAPTVLVIKLAALGAVAAAKAVIGLLLYLPVSRMRA